MVPDAELRASRDGAGVCPSGVLSLLLGRWQPGFRSSLWRALPRCALPGASHPSLSGTPASWPQLPMLCYVRLAGRAVLSCKASNPATCPFWHGQRPGPGRTLDKRPRGRLLPPLSPQEAVDDILLALKLDARTAVPEIRSLKPEAQALVTRGLSSRCRALLSQASDAGVPLSDEDAQGLIAAGEALVEIDGGQPGWYILLADVLTAAGTLSPGSGHAGVRLPSLLVPFC